MSVLAAALLGPQLFSVDILQTPAKLFFCLSHTLLKWSHEIIEKCSAIKSEPQATDIFVEGMIFLLCLTKFF